MKELTIPPFKKLPPKEEAELLTEAIVVAAQLVRTSYLYARVHGGIPEDLADTLAILHGVILAAELVTAVKPQPENELQPPRSRARCNGGAN